MPNVSVLLWMDSWTQKWKLVLPLLISAVEFELCQLSGPFLHHQPPASDKAPRGAMKILPCLGQRLLLFDYCWLTRNVLELIPACVLIEREGYG